MLQEKAYIFGAIFFFANKMQNAGDKLFTEITMKQWFLLVSIIRSGAENPTLTEVSEIIGYSRQNVKKIAVHLENAGFVALKKDIDDGRVLRITLTEKCNLYFESRKGEENKFAVLAAFYFIILFLTFVGTLYRSSSIIFFFPLLTIPWRYVEDSRIVF